ncbi:MAG: ankyrin repeat domain-containing protein [Planctomycetota bacterium]
MTHEHMKPVFRQCVGIWGLLLVLTAIFLGQVLAQRQANVHDEIVAMLRAEEAAHIPGMTAFEDALVALGGSAVLDRPVVFGMTPLMLAARADRPDLIRRLLAQGASVDAAGSDGNTALVLACRSGSPAAARALLDAGADPNPASSRQRPLDLARARGDHALAAQLQAADRQRSDRHQVSSALRSRVQSR